MSFLALIVVLTILAFQVGWVGSVDENVNGTTIALVAIATVLAFAVVAPRSVKEVLDRITSLKLPGGIEIGLQAVNRAERIQALMPRVAEGDGVRTEERPRGGGALREYQAVRSKLRERLRFIRDAILNLDHDLTYEQIVEEIEGLRLLEVEERQVVYDVLGRLESDLDKLSDEVRGEYLDATWHFSSRFATLVFERLVRRNLTGHGWFLLDFEQARLHRPDFLGYSHGSWHLFATRVEPPKTLATRRRLSRQSLPFDAEPIVIVPDTRPYQPDDEYAHIRIVTLSAFLSPRD
jgi:hypothetical protein